MSLKPRLGDIATPGRVCPPHNETYDCRIRPNGIGCLRRGGTVRAGRLPDRTGVGIPDRSDIRTIRSARFPIRANGKLRRVAIPARAEKRERRRETNSPGIVSVRGRTALRATEPEMRPGERDRSVCESDSALRSPGARKARATGFWVAQDRSFPTEMPDEPGTSAEPDYILCYTSRSRRCFRPIFPDGWKPSGTEPTGKCLYLAHSVY